MSNKGQPLGHIGIDAIHKKIQLLYPDQKNHVQASAVVKYSDGGPDPLDLVSILFNKGNKNVPSHWHYVTFGLSDLYGDGKAHTKVEDPDEDSGFGFELTFRLKANKGESAPVWPATLLNSLARYVFKSGNLLHFGDHIPWKQSLAPVEHPSSLMQHMLVGEDSQLTPIQTSLGRLEFRQIVGIMDRELKAAQQWKGSGVLDMISQMPNVGPLLLTDMSRSQSLFDLTPQNKKLLTSSLEKDGSNLGHVTCVCSWEERQSGINMEGGEEVLDSVSITFDANCIDILPTIAKGRLLRGRYFIFQNVSGQVVVLVPSQFQGEMVTVDAETPLRAQGKALQIYCRKDFIIQLIQRCELTSQQLQSLPLTLEFSNPHVLLTITPPVLSLPG